MKKQKGFTLVELMLFLFLVTSIAVFELNNMSFKGENDKINRLANKLSTLSVSTSRWLADQRGVGWLATMDDGDVTQIEGLFHLKHRSCSSMDYATTFYIPCNFNEKSDYGDFYYITTIEKVGSSHIAKISIKPTTGDLTRYVSDTASGLINKIIADNKYKIAESSYYGADDSKGTIELTIYAGGYEFLSTDGNDYMNGKFLFDPYISDTSKRINNLGTVYGSKNDVIPGREGVNISNDSYVSGNLLNDSELITNNSIFPSRDVEVGGDLAVDGGASMRDTEVDSLDSLTLTELNTLTVNENVNFQKNVNISMNLLSDGDAKSGPSPSSGAYCYGNLIRNDAAGNMYACVNNVNVLLKVISEKWKSGKWRADDGSNRRAWGWGKKCWKVWFAKICIPWYDYWRKPRALDIYYDYRPKMKHIKFKSSGTVIGPEEWMGAFVKYYVPWFPLGTDRRWYHYAHYKDGVIYGYRCVCEKGKGNCTREKAACSLKRKKTFGADYQLKE